MTGNEIEGAFVDALYVAFDHSKEPTDLTIAEVLTEFVPLSKLMSEQITGLRNWSKGRTKLATSVGSERKLRRIAVLFRKRICIGRILFLARKLAKLMLYRG